MGRDDGLSFIWRIQISGRADHDSLDDPASLIVEPLCFLSSLSFIMLVRLDKYVILFQLASQRERPPWFLIQRFPHPQKMTLKPNPCLPSALKISIGHADQVRLQMMPYEAYDVTLLRITVYPCKGSGPAGASFLSSRVARGALFNPAVSCASS